MRRFYRVLYLEPFIGVSNGISASLEPFGFYFDTTYLGSDVMVRLQKPSEYGLYDAIMMCTRFFDGKAINLAKKIREIDTSTRIVHFGASPGSRVITNFRGITNFTYIEAGLRNIPEYFAHVLVPEEIPMFMW